MHARNYWSDLWLMLTIVGLPGLLALPFIYSEFLTYNQASLFLAVKTLGIIDAPGYPIYLLLTHVISWLLPFGHAVYQGQFIHIIYLGCLAGLVYLLGRTLVFSPLVCMTTALGLIFTPWIWPNVLIPIPLTLHLDFFILFLIWICRLIVSPPLLFLPLAYFCLGILGGISAGQEWLLGIWVGPALFLLITIYRKSSKGSVKHWTWLGLGLCTAIFGPYSYLISRLFSQYAFINFDLVPQLSAWRATPTLELIGHWLILYFREPKFLMPNFGNTVTTLRFFFSNLPFLTLCFWLLGAGITTYQLFFTRTRPQVFEKVLMARSLMGILPFIAIVAAIFFFNHHMGTQTITWVLSGTLWGFTGCNHIYESLGHPATRSMSKPNSVPTPTLFGKVVLILVPLLAWAQVYPSTQSRYLELTSSSLAEKTRAFLNSLPPKALLIFPQHTDSHFIAYLQTEQNVRTDIKCIAWSEDWPNKPYIVGRTSLELLSDTPEARARRRLIFADYWNQCLYTELSNGRSVYLITPPFSTQPLEAAFQQCFELALECKLAKRLDFEKMHTLLVWRVHPRPPKLEPRLGDANLPN